MKNPAPDGSPYRDIVVDDGPKAAIALRDMLRDEIACSFRDSPKPPPRDGTVAAGRYLCKTLRSGLQCLDCDLELAARLDMVSVSPRCIRVSALFEGASSWEVAGQQHVHPGQGIAQISALGQDTPIGFCEPMGQRYRMAGLLITPGFFDQGPEDLQDGLKELRALLDPGSGITPCRGPWRCATSWRGCMRCRFKARWPIFIAKVWRLASWSS